MNWIKDQFNVIRNNSLDSKKQKQFGFLLLFILLLIVGTSIYKEGLIFNAKQQLSAILMVLFMGITILFPKIFFPILLIWFIFGAIIGEISSFIILGIIYYLFFSPITIFMRIFKKEVTCKPKWIVRKEKINYEKLY